MSIPSLNTTTVAIGLCDFVLITPLSLPLIETLPVNDETAIQIQDVPIVFFDGVCGLCNHTVNFLMSQDRQAKLRFAPLQGETAKQLVPPDVRTQLNTFVFSDSGKLSYRSSAFVKILMRIGGFWSIVGGLIWLVPWPLRDVGYRIVAALRYKLFGKSGACRLPTPEERLRFLD